MDKSTPSQRDSPSDSRRHLQPDVGKHASSSPTFGKMAIVIMVIAIVVYMYQVQKTVDSDATFDFAHTTGQHGGFSVDTDKRDAVVAAFKHAWSAYERDAMGSDEYHPLSKTGSNLTNSGGVGYTVIDAIDTMQIMGLQEEYNRARDWISTELRFDRHGNFNTFETTIRILGGLLSAYHLSDEDSLYLEKAIELADRMLPAFDTASGLPSSMINLELREGIDNPDTPGLVSTAEAATLQLEFRYLSFLTDNDRYWDAVEHVMRVIKAARLPSSALVPIYLSSQNGKFLVSDVRLGSRGDSFYEYLLKQFLQTSNSEEVYREMYQDAMQAIHGSLVQKGLNTGLTYTAELIPDRQAGGQIAWRLSPKQDHLVCFLGGSLMLGATTTGSIASSVSTPPLASELSESGQKDWKLGYEIINTCMDTHETATGLSPEIVYFYTKDDKERPITNRDWYIKNNRVPGHPSYDARYILRPETIESLFIAYRLTGDNRYREYGWKIFQSIEKYCRLESGGYASILNVDDVHSEKIDKMETFFMSETLKYLYLLFSDASILPLDKYVFNTEAHPLPIFIPSIKTGFF
ncbi:glycoside hydrolase family 47 protein [Phlegmacium glaucopus]|nr:glycoside hydrolase family 47 protein [Phlegmacium glaucopus]